MAYVTYKNRTSENYRFTTNDLNDPAIAELRELLRQKNEYANTFNKKLRDGFYDNASWMPNKFPQPTYGIRIRPRGSRTFDNPKTLTAWNGRTYTKKFDYYDTPMENATRYDIYIREN